MIDPLDRRGPDRRGRLVVEVSTNGGDDAGPMRFITQARLDYYRRVEAEWRRLTGRAPAPETENPPT